MDKIKRQVRAFFAVLLMAALVLPGTVSTVHAAGISDGKMQLTVNQSVVAFGGYEWWVIGNAENGVYSRDNSVTLLAKELQSDWKNVAFRKGQSSEFEGSTKYEGDGWYYDNNPQDMESWTSPNEYAGSTLQQEMKRIAENFPEKEQSVINARDLSASDGIAGQDISNQKLWALSEDEWATISNNEVRKYDAWWWLRSPYSGSGDMARQGNPSGDDVFGSIVDFGDDAARPALNLNLESVLFTSLAAEGGKSSANVGVNLVEAETPSGTVKFTMKDDSQTLTVTATKDQSTQTGSTLSFAYSDATTGENQYVSCVLEDSDSGDVKYYGKLSNSSSADSGELSIPLTGVADGTYTLQIFSEEANGDFYTDFCSKPVTMTVEVESGSGTVSNFKGNVLHKHNWSDEWSSNEIYHWRECEESNCPITNANKKDGYGEHAYITATCTNPAVCGSCGKYNGTALGHDWNEPVWGWTNDYSSATATFICGNDASHTEELTAKITSITTEATATEDGQTVYTATVEWVGKSYIDTKTVVIPATETTPPDTSSSDDQTGDKDNPGTGATDSPQTGDDSNIALWISLMGVAAAGLGATLILQKRRRMRG